MAIGTGETFMDDLTKIFGLKSADAKAEKLKEFTDQSLERRISEPTQSRSAMKARSIRGATKSATASPAATTSR